MSKLLFLGFRGLMFFCFLLAIGIAGAAGALTAIDKFFEPSSEVMGFIFFFGFPLIAYSPLAFFMPSRSPFNEELIAMISAHQSGRATKT